MNRNGALAGMVVGAATVLFWIYAPITINGQSLSATMYELVPGFILCTVTIIVVSKLSGQPKQSVSNKFDEMLKEH